MSSKIQLTVGCNDFEICSENSDAECFCNSYIKSVKIVTQMPHICDICVYNSIHKHHTLQSWITYRNNIGIPPKY
jgi:hypothetical protein